MIEVLHQVDYQSLAWGALALLGMFSQAQKEWIRRRDTDPDTGLIRCQFIGVNGRGHTQCLMDEREAGGRRHLHCHHIIPAGWYKSQLIGVSDDPQEATENYPENGIVLCEKYHHLGPNGIHPDYAQALINYRRVDKEAFKNVQQSHGDKGDRGEIYWNTEYDDLLTAIARERTEDYLATHPNDPFPY